MNDDLVRCHVCGNGGTFDNPLRWDTWSLPFVSSPFPAHPLCMVDLGYDQATEAEMHEAMR